MVSNRTGRTHDQITHPPRSIRARGARRARPGLRGLGRQRPGRVRRAVRAGRHGDPARTYLRDRAAIRATMATLFAGALRGSRGLHDVQRVRFLGDDTAVVISRGGVLPAGQAEPDPASRALDTWVLSRAHRRLARPRVPQLTEHG